MTKRKTTNEEQPTPIDPETAPEPLQEAQAETVRESRDVPAETVTEQLSEIDKDIVEAEPEAVKETRREAEAVLNKPIEAIEDAVNELDRKDTPETPHDTLSHAVPATTVVFGRVIPLPVYTVVFITLGIITLVEVASAEIFPDGFLLTLWLGGLSVAKAVLVMYFYMHLKDDSRIFAGAIILPIVVALIATLFLTSVAPTGY
ncbi:MAG TPA: cytochrome C oxidase subunit IV family protein [Oceanobacillus sp.]|nr:cytochrome C oxidase subunit IV family protein [Oceanobacillus sp.]